MPILIDEELAMTRLKAMVQDEVCPTLGATELQLLLDNARRAYIWTASTVYKIGDVVIPTTNNRNGHRYQIIAFDGDGVSSAATEPSWSTSRDSTISDGNVTWQEVGMEVDLWDLQAAACAGWQMKLAKVSGNFKFASGDQSFDRQQVFDHCQAMVRLYSPVMIA